MPPGGEPKKGPRPWPRGCWLPSARTRRAAAHATHRLRAPRVAVVALLALSPAAAHNNLYLPGDAFFATADGKWGPAIAIDEPLVISGGDIKLLILIGELPAREAKSPARVVIAPSVVEAGRGTECTRATRAPSYRLLAARQQFHRYERLCHRSQDLLDTLSDKVTRQQTFLHARYPEDSAS